MADETASLDMIYPKGSSTRGVQGRSDSLSGVEGSFTFDVIHRRENVRIGQIKLKFNCSYDSNRYPRSTSYDIIHDYVDYIQIRTENHWGGYGHGTNTCKFFVSTSKNERAKEEIKNYVKSQGRDEY
ncbi:6949_t:CDS:1 [Ambispora gerdemannii]|uniref:6949_t:CDS:1 n=1 Tax=Ambispora gerdemannii TaxID=144530 RepID=A0A9N9GNY8_9GLOM|nr:6949_t:CDS:1 [Ambispora gerdemannii]